jgi:disulfide bond formation protein DsbB
MLICPLFVLAVLTALFALAWRFEPTMVVDLLVLMLMLLATRLGLAQQQTQLQDLQAKLEDDIS